MTGPGQEDSESESHLLPETLRGFMISVYIPNDQCWGNLLLKVIHYNVELLSKKVTNVLR